MLLSSFFWINSALSISIDEKIEKHWDYYQNAQDTLLQRVKKSPEDSKFYMTRTEWEGLLKVPKHYQINKQEEKQIRKKLKVRIADSLKKARENSIIDLDRIRIKKKPHIRQFCIDIPKGGMLHVHPFGTLPPNLAKKFLTKHNPPIPSKYYLQNMSSPSGDRMLYANELEFVRSIPDNIRFRSLPIDKQQKMLEMLFLPPGNHFFPRFESVFTFVDLAIKKWDDLYEVFWDFAERNSKINVSYVEFTNFSSAEIIPNLNKIERVYREQYGIVARFNHSFVRTESAENQKKAVEEFLSYQKSPFVVGIDLLGEETDTPAFDKGHLIYARVLSEVKSGKSRLHLTMHSGEHGDLRNPRDAMILGAERLGHGVALQDDLVALEYAIKNKIAVEANLISNIRLKAVDSIENHPFLDYLRLGLLVSLSTDSEGIFKSSLADECVLAIQSTNITYWELKKLAFNSIISSFVDNKVKRRLLIKLEKDFQSFENNFFSMYH